MRATEPRPPEEWPWREIVALERLVLARLQRLPRCQLCGNPLCCGQQQEHSSCRASRGSEGSQDGSGQPKAPRAQQKGI